MEKYTAFIIKHRKIVITLFVIAAFVSALLSKKVNVDYQFVDYLPDDAKSTISLDKMEEEYDQAIPNMRVMIYDVTIAQALEYKEELMNVTGVEEVDWLDDSINIYEPLEMADVDTVDAWYKDGNAIFRLTIDETDGYQVVQDIRAVIGEDNCMAGSAVSNALSPITTSSEIQKVMLCVIPLVFLILFLTTESWFEPFLFMATIGIAIVLNRGTNLAFGTISFVTNAAGSILQLAVSMDYSIFLLHRFAEKRREGLEPVDAMVKAEGEAVSSILSSGLTTVTGFAALILMSFKIGPDMGWVMTKAIIISLFTVLTLLPALAISFYKYIDKTEHRSFMPSFGKFAKLVYKIRIPAVVIFLLTMVPCYLAQESNDFLYGSSKIYSTDDNQMGRDLIAIEEAYGTSNAVVLMVPIGDEESEVALNDTLKNIDGVTSMISYVNTVGTAVPTEYLPDATLSKLYSENYSRIVLTLDTQEGEDGCFELVDEVRDAAAKYYGDDFYYAGDLVSTEDLKTTITADTAKVNALAIGFVFVILLLTFQSISIPVILTLIIETSIWMNLSFPYFSGITQHYISYLIISSVQLGATIDYAILFTERYMEFRKEMGKREAAMETIKACTVSVFTSAAILTFAGLFLGQFSTNLVLSQLGTLVGRGAVISFVLVLFVLPNVLMLFDKVIEKTTRKTSFYKIEKTEELDITEEPAVIEASNVTENKFNAIHKNEEEKTNE